MKEFFLKEFTDSFDHFKFSTNYVKDDIIYEVHDKLENYLISIIPEQYDELLNYMLGKKFTKKEDYIQVKKRLFHKRELNIKATNLNHPQIINEMLYKLIKVYFMEKESESYQYDGSLIETIISIIRPVDTYKKYYPFMITNTFKSGNTHELIVIGNIDIEFADECDFSDIEDIDNEISTDYKVPISYENFLSAVTERFLFSLDGHIEDFEELLDTEIVYSNPPKGVKRIHFNFLFNTYNTDYTMTVEELFVEVSLTLKRDAHTVWEQYIHEAIDQYHNEKFEVSFLLGAVAIESLIEYALYNLNIQILSYISSYLNDLLSETDLSSEEIENYLSNDVTGDNMNEIKWAFKRTKEYQNSNRNLIDVKFRDTIYLMEFLKGKTVEQILNTFGTNDSFYKNMQEKLKKVFDLRNYIAHGEDIEDENIDFKYEFENLLIILFKLIFELKDSSIVDEITEGIQ